MRIGFVGYSAQNFDENKAMKLIEESMEDVEFLPKIGPLVLLCEEVWIISGLTNLGIPKLAYSRAYPWMKTMGIACKKAFGYEQFPCDRVIIVGDNWGDESTTFLASIDVLIRIGGGEQSKAECAKAKELGIPVIEKELEVIA